jgi:acyl dehydratase
MPVDLRLVGNRLAPTEFKYSERDVILYALGVGCGSSELPFVYEKGLQVLPTFAMIPSYPGLLAISDVMDVNPMMILHAEHRIELCAPIPRSGTLITTPTITGIYDKGKSALVVIETETVLENGACLSRNVAGLFIRGEGGFGGDRGPSGPRNIRPERAPDKTVEATTLPQQALLYRLSGDWNPFHVEPSLAKMGGFDTPILQGLCTFGFVGRAVLATWAGNDPTRFRSFEGRFSGVVYPGETIVTEMWDEGEGRILVQAKTKERGDLAIGSAAATIGPALT